MVHYKAKRLPSACNNITQVRNEIDEIDHCIMKLFGLRFQFVKQIVKFKDLTQESIVAADRQQQVFDKRREWAIDYGLNPDVFEQIYRDLIKHFVDEEMKIVGNKTIK